jgi:Ca-activated chloride channel family protein
MDAIRLNGEKDELKKEIVALAKEFGVMTKYTSWLVLEDAARSPRPETAGRRGADEALRDFEEELRQAGNAPAGDPKLAEKGEDGVAASREAQELAAGAPAPAEGGWGFRKKDKNGKEERAMQVVGGRTFFGSDDGWFDSRWDGKAETVKVEYLSDAYFKLVTEKPELGKFFALGNRVVVVAGDTVYEVTKPEKK